MMSRVKNISSYEIATSTLYKLGLSENIWELEVRTNGDVSISWEELTADPAWRTQKLRMAQQVGLTEADLDKLSVIHVAGTKGKGSTCHFVERILRSQGYKVGLFSSPHLLEIRERIRVNGHCISEESFAEHFWHCYDNLADTVEIFKRTKDLKEKATWFTCLTLMAIRVFTLEQVDVAVFETGMGGEYDTTNIFRSPVVCGITTLDYDHMEALGETLSEIAWHKAGIFKHGVPAYTVMQPENCIQVMKCRANEKECDLKLVPSLEEYDFGEEEIILGIQGDVQRINASLAMQLCKEWMNRHSTETRNIGIPELGKIDYNATVTTNHLPSARPFVVPFQMKQGLRKCFYPGRSQVIKRPGLTFYLDVAHTPKSIQECAAWFSKASKCEHKKEDALRIGMVALSKERDPMTLMEGYFASDADLDYVVVSPGYYTAEAMNRTFEFQDKLLENAMEMENACKKLLAEKSMQDKIGNAYPDGPALHPKGDTTNLNSEHAQPGGMDIKPLHDRHSHFKMQRINYCSSYSDQADLTGPKLVTFYDLEEALYWASGGRDFGIPVPTTHSLDIPDDIKNAKYIQVFITTSFKLVSNVIRTVEPSSLGHYQ